MTIELRGEGDITCDGQAAIWMRGEAEAHAVQAERISGLASHRLGTQADDDSNKELAELAEAHRAAAKLLRWWAERSARKHRGEAETDELTKRIAFGRERLAEHLGSAERFRKRHEVVPDGLATVIARMQQDLAWLEELQRHKARLTCVVCSCELEPPEGPPHCEDCLLDPDEDYS